MISLFTQTNCCRLDSMKKLKKKEEVYHYYYCTCGNVYYTHIMRVEENEKPKIYIRTYIYDIHESKKSKTCI